MRQLVVVLGDQLDRRSAAFDGFDPAVDAVWMAESRHEAARVWSTKPRIATFFAAMRAFAEALRDEGLRVHYRQAGEPRADEPLLAQLEADLAELAPRGIVVVEPGEWAIREGLRALATRAAIPLDERPDRHFLCSHEEFARHARGRRQLRMEFFYREMRERHRVLLAPDGGPEGGQWNFDADNRSAFGRDGPRDVPRGARFPPDAPTRQAIADVERLFAAHPGSLERFDWPVTRAQALAALDDFVASRLAAFGEHQDAMWTGEPFLWHSRLSAALNLKLLDPREVIAAAERAYRDGRAPLASVEGFVRQILGWREYVRGVYWQLMPGYLERNALAAQEPLPHFYWNGRTDMRCLAESIGQTLEHGYAHHIQRLMVTGLFALLLGVDPRRLHEWYLAVYVDAVEWVELPNTLGMSQYADGGVMASKPYVATGRYIQRMSNYCAGCRYDPAQRLGDRACPFTTLYWDFLLRHERSMARNPRMSMQLRNLARIGVEERDAITAQAVALRARLRTVAAD